MIKPSTKLKALQWNKLSNIKLKGTFWTQKEVLAAIEELEKSLDVKEIESIFEAVTKEVGS